MLLVHTTLNLSMYVFPVLDTSLGYLYVLVAFAAAAIVVTGYFGPSKLLRKEAR
jgi:hypothetical protein